MQRSNKTWSAPKTLRTQLTHRDMQFVTRPSPEALAKDVIVGVLHRNDVSGLRCALQSVLAQDIADRVAILIMDDCSDEGWLSDLDASVLLHPCVIVVSGRFGSPAHSRNALLDLVDAHFPTARWVARLDSDDVLAETRSLSALVEAGDREGCDYVLGSNLLRHGTGPVTSANWAHEATLKNPTSLNHFIQRFCRLEIDNELPSCNLLLRVRRGLRYPNVSSAEDHWLVAGLLMHTPHRGCVVTSPPYAIYSLNGNVTRLNKRNDAWTRSRNELAQASAAWLQVASHADLILGWGQEGVVWKDADGIFKRFYSHSMSTDDLLALRPMAMRSEGALIGFDVLESGDSGAIIQLVDTPLDKVNHKLSADQIRRYLIKLYRARLVTSNIKRDNLRLSKTGELQYIDIGRDIVPLTASRFLDCAARLYAIGLMGWPDHELARRETRESAIESLEPLLGFADFYRELLSEIQQPESSGPVTGFDSVEPRHHGDVTFLIKACPQDADTLAEQVMHLTGEFRLISSFHKVVLLLDPYEGPYLRQFNKGDPDALRATTCRLRDDGWIDDFWIAPTSLPEIEATYKRWFAQGKVHQTHTTSGAPLFAQLWAFQQIETTFVLQADVDVLVSLSDASHDVISDMKTAMRDESVWCTGFNIPMGPEALIGYRGEPNDFAPEVRFGLLHIPRVMAHQPFENPVREGRFLWMWHRVLEYAQTCISTRSVRGGDYRSCYIHPRNEDKRWPGLPVTRDLFSQGIYPVEQIGCWDLVPTTRWCYPQREEDIVIVMLGRDTSLNKLERSFQSLRMQSDQNFGVIFVDDGGEKGLLSAFHHRLKWLKGRLSLVRRPERVGHIKNLIFAARGLCTRPETLLVVLDQDDALLGADTVERLRAAMKNGAELINGPMFRPDKPLQLYPVDYDEPRAKGGGNVWAHLRAFTKSLFDRIPSNAWTEAPDVDCLTDFLTMVPMAELTHRTLYLDGPYVYLHDRVAYPSERKRRESVAKNWLFTQQPYSPELASGTLEAGRNEALKLDAL